MRSRSGQALIETLSALVLLGTTLAIGLPVIYAGYGQCVLNHLSYEGALCVAEGKAEKLCQNEFLGLGQKLLPIGEFNLKIKNYANERFYGEGTLTTIIGGERWTILEQEQITLSDIRAASR
jgi:hypothetical protein